MPKKISTPTFILELPLVVGSKERLRLEKAFEIGRKIYNATLATALARLKRMREDPAWKKAVAMPKGKERNSEFSRLQKKFDLTLNGLRTIIRCQNTFPQPPEHWRRGKCDTQRNLKTTFCPA